MLIIPPLPLGGGGVIYPARSRGNEFGKAKSQYEHIGKGNQVFFSGGSLAGFYVTTRRDPLSARGGGLGTLMYATK